MNKSLIWAWVIKNSIVIIAWTVLAIVFNKWWIAFFVILFMNDLDIDKEKHK